MNDKRELKKGDIIERSYKGCDDLEVLGRSRSGEKLRMRGVNGVPAEMTAMWRYADSLPKGHQLKGYRKDPAPVTEPVDHLEHFKATGRFEKPSELLRAMSSHSILGADMLDACDFDTDAVPTFTAEETARDIEARGLGGSLPRQTGDRLIYGWTTAQALVGQYLDSDPSLIYEGRGKIFSACLTGLEAAGR